jgi:zinc ribbon protein/uncharacterized protein DUF4177
MYCIKCGADITTTAKFCTECGALPSHRQETREENAHQSVASLESSKKEVDSVMRILLAVAVILLGAIASLLAVQTLHHPPEEWQYTIIAPSDDEIESVLNKDGADGWEVVAARRASSGEGPNAPFSYELILKKRGRYTPPQPSGAK